MAKKNKETASLVTTAATESVSSPNPDAIATRAFQYYIQEGRVEGRDLEYWLRAEKELSQEFQKPATRGKGAIK